MYFIDPTSAMQALDEQQQLQQQEGQGPGMTPTRSSGTTISLRRQLFGPFFTSINHRSNLFPDNILAKAISFTDVTHLNTSLVGDPAGQVHYQSWQSSYALTRPVFNVGDRFIPRRRGVDLESSRHRLLSNDENKRDCVFLDVFKEVTKAVKHWRKGYMERAFKSCEMFNGFGNKRVLNISNSSTFDFKGLRIQEYMDDPEWDCQPRRMPLLNLKGENSNHYRDRGAQIFRFVTMIRFKNLLDWGSQNILACGLADHLCIYAADDKSFSGAYSIDCKSYVCCVKWNSKGTHVTVCTVDGKIELYHEFSGRTIWSTFCQCHNNASLEIRCKINCIVWVKKYKHIITGCDEGRVSIMKAANGRPLKSILFDEEIVTVSISPSEQYLAISGENKIVSLFNYPSIEPMFEIAFDASVKAMAWHPWQTSVLCLGGGFGDGSLSLWNVSKQQLLGYRKVKFTGSVDHLSFNRLSGELLVHWFYLEDHRLRSKIAVLAGLDRIVDAVPIQPEHRILNIAWNPDHTQLAMQHRDTLIVWNFFGDKSENWKKPKKIVKSSDNSKDKMRNYGQENLCFVSTINALENSRRGKPFDHYIIR